MRIRKGVRVSRYKYIYEGTQKMLYRYEVYADSDKEAYDHVQYGHPYWAEIVASVGDVEDIKLISKEEIKPREDNNDLG